MPASFEVLLCERSLRWWGFGEHNLLRILKPARLGFTSWCKSHRAKYCAKHCHLFVIVLIFQPASFSYRVYLLSGFVFYRITETNVPNQFIVSLVRLRLLPHYRWVQKFFLCHVCTFAGFKLMVVVKLLTLNFCWVQRLLDSTFAFDTPCTAHLCNPLQHFIYQTVFLAFEISGV